MKSRKSGNCYFVTANGKSFRIMRDGSLWRVEQDLGAGRFLCLSMETRKREALSLISDNSYETL